MSLTIVLVCFLMFHEGNMAGIIACPQPKLTHTSNSNQARAIGLPPGQRSDRDTGWHLEAFYTFRVNNNITITPGVFWLTAPNHDERNPDVVVGAVRTTFNFQEVRTLTITDFSFGFNIR